MIKLGCQEWYLTPESPDPPSVLGFKAIIFKFLARSYTTLEKDNSQSPAGFQSSPSSVMVGAPTTIQPLEKAAVF
jgi:hypothetical protein